MELTSLDRSRKYTATDYYNWDFPERVELIKRKVYEMMPAPSPYHQKITGNILYRLIFFSRINLVKFIFHR